MPAQPCVSVHYEEILELPIHYDTFITSWIVAMNLSQLRFVNYDLQSPASLVWQLFSIICSRKHPMKRKLTNSEKCSFELRVSQLDLFIKAIKSVSQKKQNKNKWLSPNVTLYRAHYNLYNVHWAHLVCKFGELTCALGNFQIQARCDWQRDSKIRRVDAWSTVDLNRL